MEKKIERVFHLGLVRVPGRRLKYQVNVEAELKYIEDHWTFGVSASVERGNSWIMGGQCLDSIEREFSDQFNASQKALWDRLYRWWKLYHLNDLTAGTPEQEAAVKAWKAQGNEFDYNAVTAYLKEIGLWEIPFTGILNRKRVENVPYKYGHGWITEEIPQKEVVDMLVLFNQ